MSQIKLLHSGGNGVSIVAPDSNPASDRTLKLPSDGDGTILTTNSSVGKILQVVSTTKTDTASTTTSGSWVDISGLSVTITPSSASSKIFIMLTIGSVSSAGGYSVGFLLRRNDTRVGNSASDTKQSGIGNAYAGNQDYLQTISTNFLDSPNTTSATTYKVQWRNSSGTSYLGQYTGNATEYNGSSTITVMEVAA